MALGSLPQGTAVIVAEKKLVRCLSKGLSVPRCRVVEPCAGWISEATLHFPSPPPKHRKSMGQSFWDGDDLTRYLATAEDSDDIREWKQRAAKVVVRQHQRALAAVRRKRFVKSVEIEKQQKQLDALKAQEAHITQLILDGINGQRTLTTRDDLLVATRGRSYELQSGVLDFQRPTFLDQKLRRSSLDAAAKEHRLSTSTSASPSVSLRSLSNIFSPASSTDHIPPSTSKGQRSSHRKQTPQKQKRSPRLSLSSTTSSRKASSSSKNNSNLLAC